MHWTCDTKPFRLLIWAPALMLVGSFAILASIPAIYFIIKEYEFGFEFTCQPKMAAPDGLGLIGKEAFPPFVRNSEFAISAGRKQSAV